MARTYAADTPIGVDRTISEIKDFLRKHGATGVQSTEGDAGGNITFGREGRSYIFQVRYRPLADKEFQLTPSRRWQRDPTDAKREWERHQRAVWRTMFFLLRAKWTAVDEGMAPFWKEFLPYLLVEGMDGTVTDFGDMTEPMVRNSLDGGRIMLRSPSPVIALPPAGGR